METISILLQAAAPQQPKGGAFMQVGMLLLIVVVFYFFMIRPQQKRQKEQLKFRDSLKKGDKVITSGGIYGKISEVSNNYIVIEVEGGMKLKVDKNAIHKDSSDIQGEVK